jgi:rubrerythrin
MYSTINTYISDAQKDNNSELENMWNIIKEDRKRHMEMLRKALEKEAKEEKLSEYSPVKLRFLFATCQVIKKARPRI